MMNLLCLNLLLEPGLGWDYRLPKAFPSRPNPDPALPDGSLMTTDWVLLMTPDWLSDDH